MEYENPDSPSLVLAIFTVKWSAKPENCGIPFILSVTLESDANISALGIVLVFCMNAIESDEYICFL